MPAAVPQVTIAKPIGGVLPVTAAATYAAPQTNGHRNDSASKNVAARLKVVIRRLAPGLTQDEFLSAVGEEWKLGKGKVDWMAFKPGKVTKE